MPPVQEPLERGKCPIFRRDWPLLATNAVGAPQQASARQRRRREAAHIATPPTAASVRIMSETTMPPWKKTMLSTNTRSEYPSTRFDKATGTSPSGSSHAGQRRRRDHQRSGGRDLHGEALRNARDWTLGASRRGEPPDRRARSSSSGAVTPAAPSSSSMRMPSRGDDAGRDATFGADAFAADGAGSSVVAGPSASPASPPLPPRPPARSSRRVRRGGPALGLLREQAQHERIEPRRDRARGARSRSDVGGDADVLMDERRDVVAGECGLAGEHAVERHPERSRDRRARRCGRRGSAPVPCTRTSRRSCSDRYARSRRRCAWRSRSRAASRGGRRSAPRTRNTFAGLRSRCTSPASCAAASASQTSLAIADGLRGLDATVASDDARRPSRPRAAPSRGRRRRRPRRRRTPRRSTDGARRRCDAPR